MYNLLVLSNQVEEWEEVDPDKVHQVPVESAKLNGGVVLAREAVSHSWPNSVPVQESHTDDYVKGVKSRHAEVEAKEVLIVVEV